MPVIIALVTVISRKWGNTIGGMIASMPWVAGPIILFIAIEQGTDFAINSLPGVMMGIIGWLSFCLIYIKVAYKYKPFWAVMAGYIGYILTAAFLRLFEDYLTLNGWVTLTFMLIIATLYYFPRPRLVETKGGKRLKYDIPLRMLVMTSFVVAVTYMANMLGPTWSGILTPIPIMTAVLAMFTHYTQGVDATIVVLKGMFIGIFGFTAFLYLQAFLLPSTTIFMAFTIGLICNVIVSIVARFLILKFEV